MSLLTKIPINILQLIMPIIAIYMLFETIRQKKIGPRVGLFSVFIVTVGCASTVFTNSISLNQLIIKISVIIAVLIYLLNPAVMFIFGDTEEKERARMLAVFYILFFLLILIIVGILYILIRFFHIYI